MRRLSSYDIECGTWIDAAFASFQGRDANRALARVFAAVAHRRTRGIRDGTNNPLGVEGAGWVGFAGLAADRRRTPSTNETSTFTSVVDGSIAAAVLLQERPNAPVQAAYRSGDAVRLARAIEVSSLSTIIDLTGLGDEVAGVRQKWWSVVADSVRFRHVPAARARLR